jgi:hypothetical protein
MPRTRSTYIGAALATIAAGLLVHLHGGELGFAARDVIGDALWAAMIACWVSALIPNARPVSRYAAAYAICVGVEISQLYHTPWLDAIRATTMGHLVLGSGFDPRDLMAYAMGIVGVVLLEAAVLTPGRRTKRSTLA